MHDANALAAPANRSLRLHRLRRNTRLLHRWLRIELGRRIPRRNPVSPRLLQHDPRNTSQLRYLLILRCRHAMGPIPHARVLRADGEQTSRTGGDGHVVSEGSGDDAGV